MSIDQLFSARASTSHAIPMLRAQNMHPCLATRNCESVSTAALLRKVKTDELLGRLPPRLRILGLLFLLRTVCQLIRRLLCRRGAPPTRRRSQPRHRLLWTMRQPLLSQCRRPRLQRRAFLSPRSLETPLLLKCRTARRRHLPR